MGWNAPAPLRLRWRLAVGCCGWAGEDEVGGHRVVVGAEEGADVESVHAGPRPHRDAVDRDGDGAPGERPEWVPGRRRPARAGGVDQAAALEKPLVPRRPRRLVVVAGHD